MAKTLSPYAHREHRAGGPGPEVVDPRIADVEALARWLDYAFVLPGGFRFGVAGIVGLVPGVGDVFDAVISLYIVMRAIQLGIPRVAITRMMVNVGIEAVAGSVPLIGDLFDVVFKANRRNYRLLQSHISRQPQRRTSDWLFLIMVFGLAGLSIALPLFGLIELAKYL